MWRLPKSDLKFRLTLRIVAVVALCFAAASGYLLFDANRSARHRIDTIAELTARELALQQNKMDWLRGQTSEFPDLRMIAAALMSPGLCIAYRARDGEILQRFCSGIQTDIADPPRLFVVLYRNLFDLGRAAERPVVFRGGKVGDAVVWVDPATLAAQAWHEGGRLIVVMSLALPVLSGLVYAALASALRPTRAIRAGLERIAGNDLSARLPPFDLAELSAIRDVFNHLAENLGTALAERNELTRKLIALQDDERRHLARELHDEFGQCLAAIRALAASVSQTAARDCPTVLSECDSIARTATQMMDALRGTLFRLRPPDVDELGLAASLEGLIAGWNGRSRGRTRFEIRLCGAFDKLPADFAGNLYRIAQEAITNASKHAEATRVVLELTMREEHSTAGARMADQIELTVNDDGRTGDRDPAAKSGMGFLGMRERVATLGGRLNFETGVNLGSTLRVVIPVVLTEVCDGGASCAA
jgi:signal transduction histidine kinase